MNEPSVKPTLTTGQVARVSRHITRADIDSAVTLTRDKGRWHLDSAAARELGFRDIIAPGLLSASVVSEIGGMIDFLATMMHFEFLAPVYAGDTVEAVVTIEKFDPETRRLEATFELVRDGKAVMRGRTEGFQGGPPKRR